MANPEKKSSGTWKWLIAAIFVAILAVAVIYYIGWFDNNTHVDSVNGDNVEQQYQIDEANSDAPGEADWQNASHQTLKEEITEPTASPATPPSPEE